MGLRKRILARVLGALAMIGALVVPVGGAGSQGVPIPDYHSEAYRIHKVLVEVLPVCVRDINAASARDSDTYWLARYLAAHPELTPAEQRRLVEVCITMKLGAIAQIELNVDRPEEEVVEALKHAVEPRWDPFSDAAVDWHDLRW